jgi:hypothetical protein
VTIPQIFTRVRGPIAAMAHEAGCNPEIVSVGCVFVEIVTQSEICHIYKGVLLTIKIAARNSFGGRQLIVFSHHNTAILDVGLLLQEMA